MTTKTLSLTLAVFFSLLVSSCKDQGNPETIIITLTNTETYQYPTVGGDEDGAVIVSQAQHYSVSEIRRNLQTNWVAVYFYQSSPGYVGKDYVELEIHTTG